MPEPVQEDVLDAARRRSAALLSKDVQALLTLLHPGFIYTTANGRLFNREEYLDAYVRNDAVSWISQNIDEPRFASHDGVVVVSCIVHDVANFDGHQLDAKFRSTFTWVGTELGWQCLAGHTGVHTSTSGAPDDSS